MFRRILISFLLLASGVAAKVAVPTQSVAKVPTQSVAKVPTVKKVTRGGGSMTISTNTAVMAGMLLAFNSGYSNGCCLGGGVVAGNAKQAVAAVTGAWTTSALGFASGDMKQCTTQLKALASYIGGSAIAGFMIPKPVAYTLSERVGPTFLIGSVLMYLASSLAKSDPTSMNCFYLALMANGLQNSITSVHTGNMCRTAHFSGCSSDMGTFIGQILGGNKDNLFKLKVFIGLASSFWIGGYVAYHVTQEVTSSSLLFCAALHFLIGSGLMLK
jgi:uncharacterized membrane protein YoaK (UPF0700 family)